MFSVFEYIDILVELERSIVSFSASTEIVQQKNDIHQILEEVGLNVQLYGIDERACGLETEKPYFNEFDVKNIAVFMTQQFHLFEPEIVSQKAYTVCVSKIEESEEVSTYMIHLYASELLHSVLLYMKEGKYGESSATKD